MARSYVFCGVWVSVIWQGRMLAVFAGMARSYTAMDDRALTGKWLNTSLIVEEDAETAVMARGDM